MGNQRELYRSWKTCFVVAFLILVVIGMNNLPLLAFTYNNSYQVSIGLALYETLYGRPYRLPMHWAEPNKRVVVGLQVMEKAT